jgi:formylglycine-generating enzyme required for sulfatase activity
MTQPAPRKVRFLLHHPSQNQGFREWLGSPSSAQTFAVPTKEEPIRKAAPKQAKKSSRAKAPQQGQQVGLFEELLEATPVLTMLWIPPGRFWMGSPATEPEFRDSESPQHLVQLQGFFMSQTPITKAQWREVAIWEEKPGETWQRDLKAHSSLFSNIGQSRILADGNALRLLPSEKTWERRPVENVDWNDAMEFCKRLSQRTGRHYTLPTEAQWEYACRAGTAKPFSFGDTLSAKLANYDAAHAYAYGAGSIGVHLQQTSPVGSYPANAWGLYDMHGNVREWCLDDWHPNYEGAPIDGTAWLYEGKPPKVSMRGNPDTWARTVVRGGSWRDRPIACRSAARAYELPGGGGYEDVGIRLVCLPYPGSLLKRSDQA